MKLNVKRLEEIGFDEEEFGYDELEDVRGETRHLVKREERLNEKRRDQERNKGRKNKREERRW